MHRITLRRIVLLGAGFLGAWLFVRYGLPVTMPFLVGLLLALAAEPAVRLGIRLRLPRWAATGVGVSVTLLLLASLVGFLGAVLVRELGVLAGRLPDLQQTARNATAQLQNLLQNAASHAPAGVQPLVERSVARLSASGTDLMEQAAGRLPGALSRFLSRVPDGALGIGTAILAAFMISARLPKLKALAKEKTPPVVREKLLPALGRIKAAIGGWLKAQCKLCGITFVVVLAGFLVLQIPLAPVWAAVVALVDAVPVLGTGTVLLPWALFSLLQHQHLRSVGLLLTYAAAFLTRTILEPRLVGRHLGLDPLVTLIFLYFGYRFWGILGMLLSPMLAAALTAAARQMEN